MAVASRSQRQSPGRIVPRWFWLTTSSAALLVVGLLGFWLGREHTTDRQASLPVLTVAPGYTMTNQRSDKVSSRSLRGKVQMVTLLFPYCTTMHPLIAAHLINFENGAQQPARRVDKVVIVSFDINPRNTGPQQIRTFLSQCG